MASYRSADSDNVDTFGAEAIHNPSNLIQVDTPVHQQISGFYSFNQPQITGFTNMTVRQWLGNQSFDAQQQFGL